MRTSAFKKPTLNSPTLLVLCCVLTAALPAQALGTTGTALQLNGTGLRQPAGGELDTASL